MAETGNDDSKGGNKHNEDTVSSSSTFRQSSEELDAIRRCCLCSESVHGKPSKLLACLHTVCPPCQISHTNGGELVCAICNYNSSSTSVVENFVAHGLDANEKPVIKCSDLCPDNAVGKFHCIECDENLCAKCKEAHQRVKLTRDHRINPINDTRAVASFSTMCPKHPSEELTLYCNKCNILTCRDCQLSQEHSGHHEDYMSINEAAFTQKRNLLSFAENAEGRIKSLQGSHQLATQRLEEVEKYRSTFKSELRQAAEALLSALRNRTKELGDVIEQACEQQRNLYEGVKKPLERITAMGKQASLFAKAAASLNDKHAMLRSMQYIHAQMDLINRLRKACNFNALQVQQQPMALRLPTQDLLQAVNCFGSFMFEPYNLPSSSRSTTDCHSVPAASATASSANATLGRQHPTTSQQQPIQNLQTLVQRQQLHASTSGFQIPLHAAPSHVPMPPLQPAGQQHFPNLRASLSSMGQNITTRPNIQVSHFRPGQVPPSSVPALPPNISLQISQYQQIGQYPRMASLFMSQQQIPRPTGHCVPMPRHSAQQMPNSPNGVSSTSVTPPHGAHPNGHVGYFSERPPLQAGHPCQYAAQIQPPPLYSAVPDFNFAAANSIQRPGQQQQQSSMNFSPVGATTRMVGPSSASAALGFSSPSTVRRSCAVPQAQQQTVLPAHGQHFTGSSTITQPLGNRPPAPYLQSTNQQRPNCSNGFTADGGHVTLASAPAYSTNAASGMLSPTSHDIVNTLLGDSTDLKTIELVPISPDPQEMTKKIPNGHEVLRTTTGSDEQVGDVPIAGAIAVTTQDLSPQGISTPPTPLANVSSTTVDVECSQPGNGPAPVGQTINAAPSDRFRHMARKSISCSRPAFDSTSDMLVKQQGSALKTPSPLSSPGLEEDAFSTSGTGGLLTIPSGLIGTPASAADVGRARKQAPDAGKVTTSAETCSATKERGDADNSADSVLRSESSRSWDDWCCVCNNGGLLVCCDAPGCRRVFHHDHHIPELPDTPTEVWYCTFCVDLDGLKGPLDEVPRNQRKTMSEYELKACQRILLSVYTRADSVAFQEPVDESYTKYYEVIDRPMDFSMVRQRLRQSDDHCYGNVLDFIRDMNQVFINCATFNTRDTDAQLRAAGATVGRYYLDLVKQYLPDLVEHVVLKNPSKKRRLSRSSSNESSLSSGTSNRRRRVFVQDDDDDGSP